MIVIAGFQETNEITHTDTFTLRTNELYKPERRRCTGRDRFHYVESDHSALCVSENVKSFKRFISSTIAIGAASFTANDGSRHGAMNIYMRNGQRFQIIALASIMNVFLKLRYGGTDNAGQYHEPCSSVTILGDFNIKYLWSLPYIKQNEKSLLLHLMMQELKLETVFFGKCKNKSCTQNCN